jgi:hypothetical protein
VVVVALPTFVFACTTQDGNPFNSPPTTYANDGGSGGLEEDQSPPTPNCPPLPLNGDSCVGFDSGTGTLVCGYLCNESGGEQASATCVDASTWLIDPPGGCGNSFVDAGVDASDADASGDE